MNTQRTGKEADNIVNIPQVSTGMIAQSGALQQVGIAMLGKQLDTATSNGAMLAASLASLPSPSLEASVNPNLGGNIDLRV